MSGEEIISRMMEKGFLISPDALDKLKNLDDETFSKLENFFKDEKPMVINQDLLNFLISNKKEVEINWKEFENAKFLLEKGKDQRAYNVFLDLMEYDLSDEKKKILNEMLDDLKEPGEISQEDAQEENDGSSLVILKMFEETHRKKEVLDFVMHYQARYNFLKKILQNRVELQEAISIRRALNKSNRENISLIGLVTDKRTTKNGNIMITLEDISGEIKILINKNRKDIFDSAKDIVLDEVLGVTGVTGDKIVFVSNVVFPDLPPDKPLKKCEDEVYAVFTSDLHVGSNMFIEKDLLKFIDWINGKAGNSQQREIAQKVKYLFVVGDLVDGIGIYPGQEDELTITDINGQYDKVAEYLSMIRKDIKIIVCAGNHDAIRISEPQPVLNKQYSQSVWDLPNVTMVTNPSLVNIHSSKNFEGFDVLLYHGYCFDYYAENVESIRNSGTHISDRATLIMKYLLQKRHLAPTHGSTLFVPTREEDPLIIDKVPDFFVAGHIHKVNVDQYKHVTTICCSCWQSKTDFQEKVGHSPEPSRVPVVNLKTRETKVMKFSDES